MECTGNELSTADQLTAENNTARAVVDMEHSSNGLSNVDQLADGATASAAECFEPADDDNESDISEKDRPREIFDFTDEQSLRTSVIQWSKKYTEEERLRITRILRRLGRLSQTADDTEYNETIDENTGVENVQRPPSYTEHERSKIIRMVQNLGKGRATVDGIEDVEDLIVLVTSSGRAIDEMMSTSKYVKVKSTKWNDTRGKKKSKKKKRAGSKLQTVEAEADQEPKPETSDVCLYSHFFNTLGEWLSMAHIDTETPDDTATADLSDRIGNQLQVSGDDTATADLSDRIGNQLQVSGTDVRRAINEGGKDGGVARSGHTVLRADVAGTYKGRSRLSIDAEEQHSLQTWLRIAGIRETNNENTKEIVLTMATAVNAGIESKDILQAARHSPKSKHHTAQQRDIYVKFTTEPIRQKFYDVAKRSLRKLAGYKDVYVNDVITQERQKMFTEAWLLKKENTVKQVWTNKGEIYVKDNDMKVHHIARHSDIDKLK